MPSKTVDQLKQFYQQLKQLRADIKRQNTKQISKKRIYTKAEKLGTSWFDEFVTSLSDDGGLSSDIIAHYSQGFTRLIQLSSPNNLRKSYQEVLTKLCRSFRVELILPLQQKPAVALKISQLSSILADLPNPVQSEYLKEAIACAGKGYFRAAAVLGWCAVIDQIHRTIEKSSFASFNITSAQMASQTRGRFKKFNQVQNVNSIGELREVFDTTVLWIIEGMQLIDSNEHTRLRSCFDLRCQCAHPGNAPVTEYNLLSFFSDLNKIVFRNPKFAI